MTTLLVRHRFTKHNGRDLCIREEAEIEDLLKYCRPGDTIHKVDNERVVELVNPVPGRRTLFQEIDLQLLQGEYVRI